MNVIQKLVVVVLHEMSWFSALPTESSVPPHLQFFCKYAVRGLCLQYYLQTYVYVRWWILVFVSYGIANNRVSMVCEGDAFKWC